MIAAKYDRLGTAIRELIGNNSAMVAEFRSVVVEIHREKESAVLERNAALRDIMAQFGKQGAKHGCMAGRIIQGRDVDKEIGFDEMTEYAIRQYPHLMQFKRGESDTGTAEELLTKWIKAGIQPSPKPWDLEILQEALDRIGSELFDAYASEPPESALEPDAERTIRRLEGYYEKIKQSIEDEENGAPAIGWPKYRLSRLRNEIAKLPESVREEARKRTRLDECEDMVREHFTCTAF